MKIILTHTNADFDAVASLVGAHKLEPDAVPVLPDRLNRNVRAFMTLYRNGLGFLRQRDLRIDEVREVLLVDTQRMPDIHGLPRTIKLRILDHHPLQDATPETAELTIDETGATVTLLVERLQAVGTTLNALEATLLALGIYEDTGSMTYGTTTPRDVLAAAWLLDQGADLDTLRRHLTTALTPEQHNVFELLMKHAQTREIHGNTITLSAIILDNPAIRLSAIAHRLRDTLESAALFLVVRMRDYVQVVARSMDDAVDVGEIARQLGGGGHSRAAAASINTSAVEAVARDVWSMLEAQVQPMTTVADLMSQGAYTVEADAHIQDIIRYLRRVGHEGYPVLDGGQVIGLLTLRDADRAMEHGLKNATVREVMAGGRNTLTPRESVASLEQMIVQTGWGQIPVMDGERLLGIVTRTDLIKHWAQVHPSVVRPQVHIAADQINTVLGEAVADLISTIAAAAPEAGVNLFMVGGVVRDLLLNRPNYDIDFVVEGGRAIPFAESLQARYGGAISSYKPFGTAKWLLDETLQTEHDLDPEALPDHIDFATSRNEFYESPTALPTVYAGSIKLDLHRRDFTINTLAVQLSPPGVAGRVLDFYSGLSDLENKRLRVLHSLSFVDDPTRILRAVRFKQRLDFTIESRTAELITTSLPMLRRITGERLRNELTLLLRESNPEAGLLELAERGVLAAIHPAFVVHERIRSDFAVARNLNLPWLDETPETLELFWYLLLSHSPDVIAVCERLLVSHADAESMAGAAALIREPGVVADPDVRPSQIVARLDGSRDVALVAVWVAGDAVMREHIRQYITVWRDVRPKTNGHDLRALGLTPGPRYRVILDRLRNARLDGEVQDDAAEDALLQRLIVHEEHS